VVWELHPTNVGTGLPLEGVRVLDLSRVLAGPLCAMVLGDLGADVIKVEGPGGDPVRALAPPRLGEDATYYLAVNRHRRNVVADLRDESDAAALVALVREADVVVENYLPAQAAALGVERLRQASPDAVWVTVTPATSGGPIAAEPSFDLLAQARSGLMGVTGTEESGPTKVGAPLADVVTGLYAAIGALAGLVAHGRGAPGRRFEAPLLESTMSALINQAQGYLSTGVNPRRLGNDHPSIAPYGPFRTGDGYLLLAVGTDAQWARLVEVLGVEGLRVAAWSANAGRVEALTALRAALEAVLASASTDEWLERLRGSGVPAGPIVDIAGAIAQPQVALGDFVSEMDTPAGPTRVLATPLLVDGRRPRVRRGPRRLGEDTDEVLGR
jgi:crotonobetainyl-CoA:carnitine CoA-transferase CaiB-like acyl-CoA transferase